ncbi:FIG00645039: hypothetical protein with HTH-domain [hydrothermal vent metagenome]|uniref:Nucleotidyl transferase AbiEii/AbiGii toxin family protein n=1 Tax=hydrothermal vent metagenome TaxID=652676 RepID=A0A3B0ZV80_9ZZZZ
MERFLYRLTQSSHATSFILKGALMLRAWQSPEARPTMDIDMLGKTSNEIDSIVAQVKEIISVNTEADGLNFDLDSVKGERIKEDADYEGVRVRFVGTLANARIHMQIDVGFDDIIHPEPVETEFPTILNSPVPKLLCYSRESVIAEKFEAMLKLQELNSRMKDFYDIWLLSRQFDFEGSNLAKAISLTINHRGTSIPTEITAFSKEFIKLKQVQWAAFKKRLGQEHVPANFEEIVTTVEAFLMPMVSALTSNTEPPALWQASKSWK